MLTTMPNLTELQPTRDVSDLMLALCSLQDASFRRDAAQAANYIVSGPQSQELIRRLLKPLPLPSSESTEPTILDWAKDLHLADTTEFPPPEVATPLKKPAG